MSKEKVAGLRRDYHEGGFTDEDIQDESSEFHGISDGDHGVSQAQGEVTDFADLEFTDDTVRNVRREKPSVREVRPFSDGE